MLYRYFVERGLVNKKDMFYTWRVLYELCVLEDDDDDEDDACQDDTASLFFLDGAGPRRPLTPTTVHRVPARR